MQARTAEIMKIAAPVTDFVRLADGPTTPADGASGYCKGCLFINTTDGKLYANGGNETACAFAAVVPEEKVTPGGGSTTT